MVVKFDTNASGAMWLPNLVTESISGSVVPLAMFPKCMGPSFFYLNCTRLACLQSVERLFH